MIKKINFEDILNFIMAVNEDFTPALSEKIDLEVYSRKLFDNALIFARFDGDDICALCAVYANDPENSSAFISFFAVRAAFRSTGIAISLLGEVEGNLKRAGFKFIDLEVYCSNERAIKFYIKAGYVEKDKSQESYFLFKNILL